MDTFSTLDAAQKVGLGICGYNPALYLEEQARAPRLGIRSAEGLRILSATTRELRDYFRELRRAVERLELPLLAQGLEDREIPLAQIKAVEDAASAMLTPVVETLDKKFARITFKRVLQAVNLGLRQADLLVSSLFESEFPVREQEEIRSARAVEIATARAAGLVRGIDEVTRTRLAGLVGRGIRDKLGVPGLGRAIRRELISMSVHRSEVIARTELNDAMSEANWEGFRERRVRGKRTVLGPNPCPICIDNHNQGVIPIEEPFRSGHQHPPFHVFCFSGDTNVAAFGVTAKMSRRFDGEILRVFVEGLDDFGVTPNHPIFTQRGWIPAGQLQQGDYLFACLDPGRFVRRMNPNNHYMPAPFEKIASASGMVANPVPTTPEDFHGDGILDGEVNIVRTTRFFRDDRVALKACGEFPFVSRQDVSCPLFAGEGSVAPLAHGCFCTESSPMGSGGDPLPSDRAKPSHTKGSLLAPVTHRKTGIIEPPCDRSLIATELATYLCCCLSTDIVPVKLLDVRRRRSFSDDVYNLQTGSGFYFANSIIAHNCADAMVPARLPV